ncbi:hypothetical protein G9A89_013061 [Geosiphon pyriformis]|nr:hypothetical protein G9A89_013061 [Geosiphon pyriformis]
MNMKYGEWQVLKPKRLADLNMKLCDHCLISCHFQYCDECNLMFNLLSRTLYLIDKLLKPEEEAELIVKNMPFQEPNKTTETEHIDLKIALEIPLRKKKIDVKEGIIDARYTRNIIVILQNNSDKSYKIESHNKIAQAIFLPLVKIPQLALITTHKKLGLTAQRINEFGLSGKGNVPVNFTEENTDHEICSLTDIANLYLSAKAHKHFKISIHNLTKDVIKIPEGILVSSISANIQNLEKPQSIPDFAQLFLFCDITSQVKNLPKESYLFMPKEINKLNLGNLNTLQQMQLKILLNQYANIFASKNEFGCMDIVKHKIDTRDAQPIKQ